MTVVVEVETGGRLHFGLWGVKSAKGPAFGGLGMMIDRPGFRLQFTAANEDSVDGPSEFFPEVRKWIDAYRKSNEGEARKHRFQGVGLTIQSMIPRHRGLGSGTQLGLAIAAGMSQLFDAAPETRGEMLAQRIGRQNRSSIGTFGFEMGGLIVDAGRDLRTRRASVECRVDMPEEWRVVLFSPRDGHGHFGSDEARAFEQLPPMEDAMTQQLRSIAVDEVAAAARLGDYDAFTKSVTRFGKMAGEFFAPAQGGGIYAAMWMFELVEFSQAHGICGVAQSSWGPTMVAFARNQESAMSLRGLATADSRFAEFEVTIAAPRNRGARVQRLG